METLLAILRDVRDPRDINARHDCASMLFIALIAMLCGAKTCVDIADFAAAHEEELGQIVDLAHGAPSHDSFSRLFRLLDPEELAQLFVRFAKALREGLGLPAAKGVVAIDGKRLRRGYERGRAFMPPLMISVWDAETRLSLAARASGDGNEVKATLEALKSLDLKGCTVTADALHCHPAMAEAVRAAGAHYALKLKGNNGPLHACAVKTFETADGNGKGASYEMSERGHDRFERRRVTTIAVPKDAPRLPGLVLFARLESERQKTGGKSEATTTTLPCPNAWRRAGFWTPSGSIGESKITCIGRSMWCSMKTTPEVARTMRRKTCLSSAGWRWISLTPIRISAPPPEK
jgi:hypothetical protein